MVGALWARADEETCGAASIKTERDCASGDRCCQPILALLGDRKCLGTAPGIDLEILPGVVAALECFLQFPKRSPITRKLKTNLLALAVQKHHGSLIGLAVVIVADHHQKGLLPFPTLLMCNLDFVDRVSYVRCADGTHGTGVITV